MTDAFSACKLIIDWLSNRAKSELIQGFSIGLYNKWIYFLIMFFDTLGGPEHSPSVSSLRFAVCSSVGVFVEQRMKVLMALLGRKGGKIYCKCFCSLVHLFIYSTNSYWGEENCNWEGDTNVAQLLSEIYYLKIWKQIWQNIKICLKLIVCTIAFVLPQSILNI